MPTGKRLTNYDTNTNTNTESNQTQAAKTESTFERAPREVGVTVGQREDQGQQLAGLVRGHVDAETVGAANRVAVCTPPQKNKRRVERSDKNTTETRIRTQNKRDRLRAKQQVAVVKRRQ